MELIPYFIPGSSKYIPVYAFGESYGGAYVVSLAKKLLTYQRADIPGKIRGGRSGQITHTGFLAGLSEMNLVGIGIGNGFVSPLHQTLYAEYLESITYLTDQQRNKIKRGDRDFVSLVKSGQGSKEQSVK